MEIRVSQRLSGTQDWRRNEDMELSDEVILAIGDRYLELKRQRDNENIKKSE